MSVENLQRGMRDFREGVTEGAKARRDEEEFQIKKKETLRKRQAEVDLGSMLDESMEAQNTTQGAFLAKGVKEGLVSGDKAAGELGDMQGKKLFYQIQSRIFAERNRDPVKAQKMMGIVNEAAQRYYDINSYEAYSNAKHQAIGILEAKKQFGV